MKREYNEQKTNAEIFLFVYEKQLNKFISSTVYESQAEMQRLKKNLLPSQDDIKKSSRLIKKEKTRSFQTTLCTIYFSIMENSSRNHTHIHTSFQQKSCWRTGTAEVIAL